jgi:hypothetical protein
VLNLFSIGGFMRKGIGSHQSAHMKNEEWLTPRNITDSLGSFDLDPCAPINPPWNIAENSFCAIDDGLKQPWRGRVWLNPPYGRETGIWLEKLKKHGNGIALIFARTETDMFFSEAWSGADAMLFLRGRLHFHYVNGERAKANSGAPSVLLAYGGRNVDVLKNCGIQGAFVTKWELK